MDSAEYVISSPLNIIPPWIIIANLSTKENLGIDNAKNDETE